MILVTGGAGFIGSHTCVELVNAGTAVTVFDNFSNSHPEALARVERITGKSLRLVRGDIRDRAALAGALRESGAQAVIHFRSKAFHDESYGGLGQAGHIDDHVAVIRALASRYPYMDLDRAGIFGTSGGGYATVHAMATFPDFFKVGVADAGDHDQRGYLAVWGETYNGPESGSNYTDAANRLLVGNLKGKLFLLHGDMDTNVLPAHTYQVVDALIKANKDFDFLLLPNRRHGFGNEPYTMRRRWAYLVRHLLGAEPPKDYEIGRKPETPTGAAGSWRDAGELDGLLSRVVEAARDATD